MQGIELAPPPITAELAPPTAAIISQREATFRKATQGIAPWGLDAHGLNEWLEEKWVKSESQPADEKVERYRLLQELSDTDGLDLLTKCMIEDTTVPWAKLSQTKNDEPIKDEKRAEQLTMFLHVNAGLCFYRQMWHASADPLSPLLKYEHVQIFHETDTAIASVVRHQTCGLRLIKLVLDSNERSRIAEFEIHRRASAASQFVRRVYESATPSPGICFGAGELCSVYLDDRMARNGIDEEEFWRWAFRLMSWFMGF